MSEEMSMKRASDTQRYAYQLTINNPEKYDIDHLAIRKALVDNFKTLRYFCMADEIGENGTYHTHVYVCFTSRVRFSTVKKHFPTAHIEPSYGSAQNNIAYIKKSGKWADTDKAETSVKNTFEDYGEPPKSKGRIAEMEELYDLVEKGLSNNEILQINMDYILNIEKIDRLRLTILTDKFRTFRRLNLTVTYIFGATGTGKTRGILDKFGDSEVYRISDYKHPFDTYACESVMCFDEYRSQLPIGEMLNYLDVYPIELPARYSNKCMCATTIFLVSNWELEHQYESEQRYDVESWQAFLRRIHQVRRYNADGTITEFASVEEYLNRKDKFDKTAEATPFDNDTTTNLTDSKEGKNHEQQ